MMMIIIIIQGNGLEDKNDRQSIRMSEECYAPISITITTDEIHENQNEVKTSWPYATRKMLSTKIVQAS